MVRLFYFVFFPFLENMNLEEGFDEIVRIQTTLEKHRKKIAALLYKNADRPMSDEWDAAIGCLSTSLSLLNREMNTIAYEVDQEKKRRKGKQK